MIEILNRYTGAVLYTSATADTIAAAVAEALSDRANLTGANFTGANLTGANLSRADLAEANLYGANLTRANLTGADLSRANLAEADLTGANLAEANLTRAKTECATIHRWSLTIIGSRHAITAYPDRVLIGCHSRDIDSWLRIYAEVGKRESYDDAAIEEYGGHLRRIKAAMAAVEVRNEA